MAKLGHISESTCGSQAQNIPPTNDLFTNTSGYEDGHLTARFQSNDAGYVSCDVDSCNVTGSISKQTDTSDGINVKLNFREAVTQTQSTASQISQTNTIDQRTLFTQYPNMKKHSSQTDEISSTSKSVQICKPSIDVASQCDAPECHSVETMTHSNVGGTSITEQDIDRHVSMPATKQMNDPDAMTCTREKQDDEMDYDTYMKHVLSSLRAGVYIPDQLQVANRLYEQKMGFKLEKSENVT